MTAHLLIRFGRGERICGPVLEERCTRLTSRRPEQAHELGDGGFDQSCLTDSHPLLPVKADEAEQRC